MPVHAKLHCVPSVIFRFAHTVAPSVLIAYLCLYAIV